MCLNQKVKIALYRNNNLVNKLTKIKQMQTKKQVWPDIR